MILPDPLSVSDLFQACDAAGIAAESTAELEALDGVTGQDRAVQAVKFALGLEADGHNIFVLGPPGTGRRTFIKRALMEAARARRTPSDWCYVNNFEDPRRPTTLELPAGIGKRFATQMSALIDEVHTTLSAAFDGEDYRARYKAIEARFQEEQSKALESVNKDAQARGIRMVQTPSGMIFAPTKDGEVIGPEEFQKLPEDEKKRVQKAVEEIGAKLQKAMEDTPKRLRRMREQIAELDNQVTSFSVGSLLKDLIDAYAPFPRVVDFLKLVEQDLVANSSLIRHEPDKQAPFPTITPGTDLKTRYAVNVVVSRQPDGAAPVVIEERPTYTHLTGRIEHRAQMGTLMTDFTLIRGGALHRANGGFLILDARRVLIEPFAWEALKQALESGYIKIESMTEAYSLSTTAELEPEPIPLNVKVALVGDRQLYFLLQALDPEFNDLFKVAADFDDRIDRTGGSQRDLARLMTSIAERNSLRPLTREAICRVIEESARTAGDCEKLSTEIRPMEDLLREAHYWAVEGGRAEIGATDIDAAIESREYRQGRVRERLGEEIARGNILIDTEGRKIGQINGLAVHQLGDFAFGRPSRITARVSLGSGKVIDIEREAELGGALHSKGVLILAGFIAANYVVDYPLSLSATIAFEQSYGGIDGDSASSAELYALLSAIADIPLLQSIAVTGSVNQYGDIQAIGGVNEKIEGFFDVCNERGLTGDQGVLIPAANVKHLMLRRRVIDAVAAKRFRIFAVEHVDQGLSILTGLEPGSPDGERNYPPGTLNHLIREALRSMAEKRRDYTRGGEESG